MIKSPPPTSDGQGKIYCRNCGMSNQDGWKYCHRCGSQLPPTWEEPRCPHCGAIPPEGSAYCVRCGAPIHALAAIPPTASTPELEAPRADGRLGIMVVLAILVIALVILSMLLVTGAGDALMGRHTYTGQNAPYTNVTLYGIKDLLVVNLPGGGTEQVTASTIPKGFPMFFPTGGAANITILETDPFANYSLTINSLSVVAPFSGSVVYPGLPVTIPPGGSASLQLSVTLTNTPGLYELPLDEIVTVS